MSAGRLPIGLVIDHIPETLLIYVSYDTGLDASGRRDLGKCQRLSVGQAKLGVHVYGAGLFFGNNAWINDCGGYQNVPDKMGKVGVLGKGLSDNGFFQNISLCALAEAGKEAVIMVFAENDLFAYIQAEYDLFLKRCAHSHLSGFGVYPPVEFRRRRYVARLEESAALDNALDQRHDIGSHADGSGQVGAGPDGGDSYFMRVRPDGVDDEVDGMYV